jgi:hypothetical protein
MKTLRFIGALACGVMTTATAHSQYSVRHIGPSRGAPHADLVGPANLLKTVEAGGLHAIVLYGDGRVSCFGSNSHGQCSVPKQLRDGSTRVVAVTAGGGTGGFGISAALTEDAVVHCWGNNLISGQTEIPFEAQDPNNPVIAISAGGGQAWGHMLALRQDLSVIAWGSLTTSHVPASIQGHVAKIASGVLHGCCILTDGTVTVFGMNDSLRAVPLAARDPSTPITQLSCGRGMFSSYAAALRSDGAVVCWGDGPSVGPSADASRPFVRVAARVSGGVALRSDGSISPWGQSQITSFPACLASEMFPIREFAYGDGIAVALVPATDCDLDGMTDPCPPTTTLQYTVGEDGSANFSTIQAAIDAVPCHGRATITLRSGTYTGQGSAVFELNQKSIDFRADAGATVTIDGQLSRRCAILRGDSHEISFTGIRWTRGQGPSSGSGESLWGGGIVSTGSLTPTFTNCAFDHCVARNGGAVALGVDLSSSRRPQRSALFTNCSFESNVATPSSGTGGAVTATSVAVTLRDCTFTRNTAHGRGGAAYLEGGIVEDCQFIGNTSAVSAVMSEAGGLFMAIRNGFLGTGLIRRTRFEGNSAVRSGALTVQWSSVPAGSLVENCDFIGNFTNDSIISKAGALQAAGALTVRDCAFEGNWSPSGRSIYGTTFAPAMFVLENCSFDACCQVFPPFGFVDGGGNAYEPTCPACIADVDCDGAVGASDLGALLATFATNAALTDLNGNGVVDGADLTMVLDAWGDCPK